MLHVNVVGYLRDLFSIVMHSSAVLATGAPNYINNNNMLWKTRRYGVQVVGG